MLRIDKSGDAAAFLYLRYHMESYSCLTGRFRTVHLDDPSLWNTAKSQGDIQAQGTGGHGLNIHICLRISQFHHRTFSILFLNLSKRSFQCANLFFIICHDLFSFMRTNVRYLSIVLQIFQVVN